MALQDEITEAELSAFADGRLPARRASAVAEYLRRDPGAAARVYAYMNQDRAIARAYEDVLDEPVPPRLRETVERAGGGAWRLAAAAVLVAGLALGLLAHLHWRGSVDTPPDIETVAMTAFDSDTGIGSGDAVPPPAMRPPGYELTGKRQLTRNGRALREYRFSNASGQHLGLYVADAPGAASASGYRVSTSGDLNAVSWQAEGQAFALVGADVISGLTGLAVAIRRGGTHAGLNSPVVTPGNDRAEVGDPNMPSRQSVITNTGGQQ